MHEKTERQALAKAFCQMRSWLETAKIKYATDGYDIAVKKVGGGRLVVCFSTEGSVAKKRLVVSISTLNSKDVEDALVEFYRVTEAAGYGKPYPLSRGRGMKASYLVSPELIALRHHELRRVGSIPFSMVDRYRATMAMAVGHICRYNINSMRFLQVEKAELETYATMLTHNYVGLYEVQDPQKSENEKRLYAYLIQRFHSLLALLSKKQQSCSSRSLENGDDFCSDDTEVVDMKLSFQSMPQSKQRSVLAKVSKNKKFDIEIRELAKQKMVQLGQ